VAWVARVEVAPAVAVVAVVAVADNVRI